MRSSALPVARVAHEVELDQHGSKATALTPTPSVVVGWLEAPSTPERPRVDYPGNRLGALEARMSTVLTADIVAQAVAARQGALLVFENADPGLPIVIGLLQTPESRLFGALLAAPTAPPRATPEARVDGERIVIEGRREVVLKCGEASLTLTRDGKVLLRGAYVETHSKGIARIKGGAVKIN